MKIYRWIRVSKKRPCEICSHDDWCTYAPEANLVHCLRVESDRPSRNSMGGWLHKTDGDIQPVRTLKAVKSAPITIDFEKMLKAWAGQTDHYHLDGFAMSLGVDTDALKSLGCVWSGKGWAFPMRDAEKKIIGIRMRNDKGKWALEGSRNGLFIPDTEPEKTVWIVEGPTDTAAALTLGLNAIGRPSCSACDEMVKGYLLRQRIRRVVIITDNDRPDKRGIIAGVRGAEKLQRALPMASCLWIPPTKDLREFVNAGGTRQILESSIKDLVWGRAA